MKIGKHKIGDYYQPFIIAEIGINHGGNYRTAIKLIDASIDAGATAVKFQTFDSIHRLSKYELGYGDTVMLEDYCKDNDITFLSTPHTFFAIHFLDNLVSAYKVASTYLGNINFLLEIASKKKPILLSTGSLLHDNGMATLEEIRNALNYIKSSEVILLHCVSKYPCSNPHYNRIPLLERFGKVVGLSDHSLNIKVPRVPVIEKHIKIDNKCIDAEVSLNPKQFKDMVRWITQ